MGNADISVFVLKLIFTIVASVVIMGGILLLTEFKATVKTSSLQRLGIDFGENILSAKCLSDEKGLLNETKLNKEKADYDADKNGLSGFSCAKTAFRARTLIKAKLPAGEQKWNFGMDEKRKYDNTYEFPAALNSSDGSIVPAIIKVVAEPSAVCDFGNNGNNCYNCMEEKDCRDAGCEYSAGKALCEPKK